MISKDTLYWWYYWFLARELKLETEYNVIRATDNGTTTKGYRLNDKCDDDLRPWLVWK